jgi:predicted lipoprotein with Yx(FWY)xxD motif
MTGSGKTSTRATRGGRLRWIAFACGAALLLSAYGLGSTAASAKSTKPTVAVAKVGSFGAVLVDSKGRTLYTFTNGGQPVPCSGACATAWPPLVVKSGSVPTSGRGVTALGTTDGGRQVTQGGLPLYRYAGDAKAGQANGDGIDSFGGVWHVVRTKSGATSSKPTTAPNRAPSTSGSGY